MDRRLLLRGVQLIEAPGVPVRRTDVLLEGPVLRAIDPDADSLAAWRETGAHECAAGGCWFAPPLVDPHSVLEEPLGGRAETLQSLGEAAAAGGYGTVALLPWAPDWRDRPDRLGLAWPAPMELHCWGAFSLKGADQELAPHADQLAAGAVGVASGDAQPPLDLLERGLRLAETGERPVLLAVRDRDLSRQGFVRERVEALRAGWPLDPVLSETLPLETLLTLSRSLPAAGLRLMNLTTAEAVDRLAACPEPPQASVPWWHLVVDSGRLDPAAEGWRQVPSLGGPGDREALITALAQGVLSAVAVHHQALDPEERLLPLDQRRPGLAGHGHVLTALWQELVVRRGWSAEQLWQVLCWGPERFLGLPVRPLEPGGRRWLLFDPQAQPLAIPSLAANHPPQDPAQRGAVLASGLSDQQTWALPGAPGR
jgi:dihydroorotase